MSKKIVDLDVNNLSTTGTFGSTDGYVFLGDSYLRKLSSESLPSQSYAGTSETRGNVSRPVQTMNSNGPIQFSETLSDSQQVILKYKDIVSTNPIVTNYPWLYPLSIEENWTVNTQNSVSVSKAYPIYKVLGKGLGDVRFFKVSPSFTGSESSAGYTDAYQVNGMTYGHRQSEVRPDVVYPFDGKIYAGTLVQLITTTSGTAKETRVIPYQAGRGIPRYSENYCPDDKKLTDFPPFGELKWPGSDNAISPCLSSGVEPGDNTTCVGIALDTFSLIIPNQRMFKYAPPDAENDNEKSYNHPAPHTVGPVSIRNKGFLSPGPNRSGTYYAPWPDSYAYKEHEPIPVLTKGITTARVGAACNIALTSYGLKKQVSATDESWISVPCIPLFQGERIEAGSYIYASVKGNIVTNGPKNEISGAIRYVGQTPWDVFIDPTWGNIGWTGTPGLGFSNIPDTEVAIIETLMTSDGETRTIPYIHQSNQGSIIVHPVTTISPDPSLGSPIVYSLNPFYDLDDPAIIPKIKEIEEQRRNLKGVSGRCFLSQHVPDKAQPIGIVMETIDGTGKWDYSGFDLSTYDSTVTITTGGVSYPSPSSTDLTGGTGAGKEGLWVTYISSYPNLGTLVSPITQSVAGVGYTNGDILTFKDSSLVYSTTQYKGNNATVIYSDGELTLSSGGSGYTVDVGNFVETHNMSKNNWYFRFDISAGGSLAFNSTQVSYFQEYSTYPVGTQLRVIQGTNSSGIFEVTEADRDSVVLTVVSSGTGYAPLSQTDTIFETQIINTFCFNPVIGYTSGGQNVSEVSITSYGAGNTKDDLVLVLDGDDNAVFKFPGMPPGGQELIAGCPCYPVGTTFDTKTDAGAPLIITLESVAIDPLVSDRHVATAFSEIVSDAYVGAISIYTDGGQSMVTPWYISRWFRATYDSGVITPLRGGYSYPYDSDDKILNAETYNMTANSLRLRFTVADGVVSAKVAGDPVSSVYDFIEDSYVFSSENGTLVRLLSVDVLPELQTVVRLVSGPTNIEVDIVSNSGVYGLADGDWMFHTQRLDQVNPTVEVSLLGGSELTPYIQLIDAGTGNTQGDIVSVVNTTGSNNHSMIFRYDDNRPYIDLPPFAKVPRYRVDDSDAAWEKYSDVMSSAVNLLDKQILVELRPINSMTMENEGPDAVMKSSYMPPTQNVWRYSYDLE